MLKVEHLEVWGFEHAIRGMRNPMNSWEKSDSIHFVSTENSLTQAGVRIHKNENDEDVFELGPNDLELMRKLYLGGTEHRKFMRQIMISLDITAPLYWWKEFDTYKVGTVANSTSTMHKIHAKEFVWEDFSAEHLMNYGAFMGENGFLEDSATYAHAKIMGLIINSLNGARDRYLDYKSRGKDWETRAKEAWWQMIQLLPSSYNQKRTVTMNYENAAAITHQRHNHKQDEWRYLVGLLIEQLPYFADIIGKEKA